MVDSRPGPPQEKFLCALLVGGVCHAFKGDVMQHNFCLDAAGITIRQLVIVTPRAVDFEAGDWCKNYARHFFVGLTKEVYSKRLIQRLTCPRKRWYFPVLGTFSRETTYPLESH
ncbi:hypothetical protein TNCV_4468991 [Trichonephila clavipes]|nr:hypothetical protein TNCV_4468991 [Trichonephila clavipes]